MKLIIKGGKVLNRGFVGIVMELYNDNKEDNKTLYQELSLSNPAKIKLVSINKEIQITDTNTNEILNLIKKNSSNTLAKKFSTNTILFGSNKKNFNNELSGYKELIKIFDKDINKYTTIKKGFTYKNNDIYGIIFNNNYYIFLEKCYKTLENIKFTPKLINKCIKDIFQVLLILNKKGYIHNDIKPDNIILCKNRFKLIDWENSNYIKNQSYIITKNGNLVFNHPIKFYRIGVPYFGYKFIYDHEILTYSYLFNKKMPIFIAEQVEKSFNKVVDIYKKNKNYYLKLIDLYSFAITIIYIAELNNINDYDKSFINKIFEFYFFDKLI
jgi:serine/threonine protein kinase